MSADDCFRSAASYFHFEEPAILRMPEPPAAGPGVIVGFFECQWAWWCASSFHATASDWLIFVTSRFLSMHILFFIDILILASYWLYMISFIIPLILFQHGQDFGVVLQTIPRRHLLPMPSTNLKADSAQRWDYFISSDIIAYAMVIVVWDASDASLT